MGSAQSSHNANDPAYIIKISNSVIERLERQQKSQAQQEREEKKTRTTIKNETIIPVTPPPTPIATNKNLDNVNIVHALTSFQILQIKEKQLNERDDYWTERVSEFRHKEKKLSDAMLQEFEKTEKEINKHLPRKVNALKNYDEKKKSLLECYKKHPNELLLCDREVAEFADSVRIGNVISESQQVS